MTHRTHAGGKGTDYIGVGGVLLLRHLAHGQVFAHQEFDHLRVVRVHAVLAAETLHFDGTDLRMVAAPALANVVEQGGEVQQPGLVPAAGQLGAEGVFMHMLGHEEAPHIAQHHQRVLVHCVDVEQVVLHLADDAAEGPQVAPQHRGLVHQPHGVGDAAGLLQDLHEGGAVDRVAAEGAIHHAARRVQCAQRARGQVAQAGRGLVGQKGGQDGLGVAAIQVVAGDLDQAVFVEEAVVDAHHGALAGGVQAFLDVQQQDLAELGDRLGRPVVAAHQAFAGAHRHALAGALVAVKTQLFGHGGLQVEQQAVFMPAGGRVQAGADVADQCLVALQLLGFEMRGDAALGQFLPTAAQAGGLGHPEDGVQIAQAAG